MTAHPTRRDFLKVGAALAATSSVVSHAENAKPTLNVIYLHSHDSGRYLQPYGHSVPTPNLQRLAASGVLFRNMHSAAPTCSPSRAALLTGQSAHAAGMLGLAHLGWGLRDRRQHLLFTLRDHGYETVLAGLQHVASDPATIGYDRLLQHASLSAKDVAPAAAEYIRTAPKQQPFFLDIGFFETHREYPAPVDDPNYILPPAPLPDVPETRLDMAGFHASARVFDQGVGAVLAALDETGLRDNTIILSTTDHGIAFPNMKCSLRDTGTAVSCILSGPGVFSGPRVCNALLSHIDVFPALCDYLGVAPPEWLTGRSFLPVLRGAVEEVNENVFAEVTYHAAYEPKRSVRTRRWKYIRHFDGRDTVVLPNCDDGISKTYWMQHGWKTLPVVAHEEFYDLVFDPNEQNNLVSEPRVAGDIARLRASLDSWMLDTRDPLLHGPVPLAPGGHVVSQDADSPADLNRYVQRASFER